MTFDSLAAALIPLQHKLFYIVLSLARFNLYANSYSFILLRARRTWDWIIEVLAVTGFWTWYGLLLYGTPSWKVVLGYLLVSHMVSSPVHVQVCLHKLMRVPPNFKPHLLNDTRLSCLTFRAQQRTLDQ